MTPSPVFSTSTNIPASSIAFFFVPARGAPSAFSTRAGMTSDRTLPVSWRLGIRGSQRRACKSRYGKSCHIPCAGLAAVLRDRQDSFYTLLLCHRVCVGTPFSPSLSAVIPHAAV